MQLQRRRNVNWICNESLRLGLANSVRNWTSNLKYAQFILFFIDHVYTSESNLWSLQSRWTCDGSIFKWSNLPIQFFLLSSLFRLPHRKLLKDFLKNVVHQKGVFIQMDNTQTKPVDVVKNADPLTSFFLSVSFPAFIFRRQRHLANDDRPLTNWLVNKSLHERFKLDNFCYRRYESGVKMYCIVLVIVMS